MIKTRGIAHFSIPVTDLARSRDFYCRHLGMTPLGGGGSGGARMAFLDAGGDCVILVQVEGPISTIGLRDLHHAFLVAHDDYEAAVKALQESGVKMLYEEDRRGGVVNGPRFYFEDPDGNTLEIIDLTSYRGAPG